MESLSLIPVTLATILAGTTNSPAEEAVVKRHIAPEIAGLWELNLESITQLDANTVNVDALKTDALNNVNRASKAQLLTSGDTTGFDNDASAGSGIESESIVKLDGDELRVSVNLAVGEVLNYLEVNRHITVLKRSRIRPVDDKASKDSAAIDPNYSKCRERYNFGADNQLTTTSGDEITYGTYYYRHLSDGLPLLAIHTLYDNNAVDCSGNQVDQTGETTLLFVDYQPETNTMHWCEDGQGDRCIMSFKRLLP